MYLPGSGTVSSSNSSSVTALPILASAWSGCHHSHLALFVFWGVSIFFPWPIPSMWFSQIALPAAIAFLDYSIANTQCGFCFHEGHLYRTR